MSDHLNQKRVRKGARLLDQEYPGWADRIEVDGLVMSSAGSCVLGHVYEDYFEGLTELFGTSDTPDWKFGFTLHPDDEDGLSRVAAWEQLGLAWEPLIRARQTK